MDKEYLKALSNKAEVFRDCGRVLEQAARILDEADFRLSGGDESYIPYAKEAEEEAAEAIAKLVKSFILLQSGEEE